MNVFVTTDWVFKNIKLKNLCLFDCTWHMPNTKKNSYKEYKKKHIENALFFDIDKISDHNSKLPHMTPPLKIFQNTMRLFGVNNNSIIVLYDTQGIYSSPRVWWLFRYFGHQNVFVMNGGLNKWIKECPGVKYRHK